MSTREGRRAPAAPFEIEPRAWFRPGSESSHLNPPGVAAVMPDLMAALLAIGLLILAFAVSRVRKTLA